MNEVNKDFITGGVAHDDDFFFREAFIEDLWESLRKEHVLILAPRRMGKTSVMLRLQEKPRDDRLIVYLNVEEINTPGEFCQCLIAAIHEQHPEYLRQTLAGAWNFLAGIIGKIEKVEVYKFKIALRESEADWENNWKTKAEVLIDGIHRSKRPLLIILDELPDMILNIQKKSPERLDDFLHWFRGVRQNPHQDNIRWLIGGSVNLRSTLDHQGKINLINDLRVEPLPPFSDEEVEIFVETMLQMRAVSFQPGIIDCMKKLLGKPIPFFLQLLTQELYREWRTHRQKIDTKRVESVFNRALLGEIARDKMQHYHSRIKLYYLEDEKKAAFHLLNLLCHGDEPLTRSALFTAYSEIEATKAQHRTGQDLKQAFDDLMLLLQNDFYVEDNGNQQYDFASRTLKLWWRKYYG
ncbi:MAG: hypothetical protein ABSA16_00505 [Thermoguttaceae bacterium]